MRRRRSARQARERWALGPTRWLAGLTDSQTAWAARYPRIDRIIDLLELGPGKRYLDIGCGTGGFADMLATRAGMDDFPVCAGLAPEPGTGLIAWPEQLPFADNAFDCVTSFHFLRRFDDDVYRAFAEELSRVLAPGGVAILADYAPVGGEWLNRLHRGLLRFDTAAPDLRGWGRISLLLTHCGFGAVNLVTLGPGILPPIPRVAIVLRHVPEPAAVPSYQ